MLRRISTFATGVICGAAVGAIVAIIATPKSGDERQADWQRLLTRSAEAADERRESLKAELAAKTSRPE